MSCNRTDDDHFYIDANGCLTEHIAMPDGPDVAIHYDEIPDCDITSVDGIRCTTPLRTVIDLATDLDSADWKHMVHECLERRLFTRAEAISRVSEPDMAARPGAQMLRQVVSGAGAD